MKNDQAYCECFAIYGYLHPEDFQVESPGYYLLYVFDGKGLSDRELLADLYHEITGFDVDFAATQGFLGPFQGVKFIENFALELCPHVPGKKVCLVSRDEYNQCLENSSRDVELLEQLQGSGQLIEDHEASERGRLWNRFFRRN